MYEYLDKINSPSDLKDLSKEEILKLNNEIRAFLIENVTKTGGHLASNLGVVELTVALHRVFDAPNDRIIWDVGHQSYVHKILTGRKDMFSTLRGENGLSGFTKRTESEYDPYGAGHSSTSLSASLGFAAADKLSNKYSHTIAVIGDGSFTGGMIYEAINNCPPDSKLIIVLNENEMSISKNVGNFAKHISKIRATRKYLRAKHAFSRFLSKFPLGGKTLEELFSKLKDALKAAIYRTNFFEQFGLYYIGPIDGNDYDSVEMFLREAKKRDESVIVHLKTQKGFGYLKAQNDPEHFHAVARKKAGNSEDGSVSFSQIASGKLCSLAEKDEHICAITAAMEDGTGLHSFKSRFPKRFFDVGIAEEHAVVFSGGLACAGMKPMFFIYSSFLQRAYDQLLHDISLQNLPCVFCIDRAGLACEDGATHHGVFDVAFLSHMSHCTIFSPITQKSLENMLEYAANSNECCAIRYPKGCEDKTLCAKFYRSDADYDNFDAKTAFDDDGSFDGRKYIIITYGRLAAEAVACAEKLNDKREKSAGVILLETLSPIEKQAKLICSMLPKGESTVVFAEEGIKNGGVGMRLLSAIYNCDKMKNKRYRILAIDGDLPETGSLSSLYEKCGISRYDMLRVFSEEYGNEN